MKHIEHTIFHSGHPIGTLYGGEVTYEGDMVKITGTLDYQCTEEQHTIIVRPYTSDIVVASDIIYD
jgi:hypothetical protein